VDELSALRRSQGFRRAHVLSAVEGLDEEALATSIVPSGWTPAGLLSHLALDVERFWLREVAAGEILGGMDGPTAWRVESGRGADAVARYREECALADEALEGHRALDAPAAWPERWTTWRYATLREVLLHVINETAIHAGHLDIARELFDGTQHLVVD
jgi:uncharacterized damage-inducible protein DinB